MSEGIWTPSAADYITMGRLLERMMSDQSEHYIEAVSSGDVVIDEWVELSQDETAAVVRVLSSTRQRYPTRKSILEP